MSTPAPFNARDFTAPLTAGTTLLEASAGTGKTYALAALYLRLLLENQLGVREILVTTFTVAATAELRARIRSLIRATHDALSGSDVEDDLAIAFADHWRSDANRAQRLLHDALIEFDEAAIFTIHGFCQRVLGDRAFESATLADLALVPGEDDLITEVTMDYWRCRFYECEACIGAAAAMAKLTPGGLVTLLKMRLDQPSARILPETAPAELDVLCSELVESFEQCRGAWENDGNSIRAAFADGGNGWAKYEHGDAAKMAINLDSVAACFRAGGSGQERLEKFASSLLITRTRKGHKTPASPFFDACERWKNANARFDLAVQLDFLKWAPPRLTALKERLGVQSYGDLLKRLLMSLNASGGDALTASIRARYRAALVDEFQDTDPVQDEIFQRLFGSGESHLYLIGDPKQAIYGFRGADVFAYLHAAKRVAPERSFTLDTNYRSAKRLVNATNALFNGNARSFVIDRLDFHDVKSADTGESFALQPAAPPLRVWWADCDAKLPIDDVRDSIARNISAEIARLLSSEAQLEGQAISPQDIAVLARTNEQAELMRQALAQYSIPTVLLKTASVFRSEAAAEMLSLLAAVLQPAHSGRMRAALVTRTLGLDFTELDALNSNTDARDEWAARFQGWHTAWIARGFMAMFQRLMLDANVLPRLLALNGGERHATNFLHLAELLQKSASADRLGPRALVEWLGRQIADPDDFIEEHELRLERDDDAVRIVTIHKSKGLEYNIVFCPFLFDTVSIDKPPRLHDQDDTLVIDLGSDDLEANVARAEIEELAASVRALYVAFTRAKHRCDIVWGNAKNAHQSAFAWLLHPSPINDAFSLKSQSQHALSLSPVKQKADFDQWISRSDGAVEILKFDASPAPGYRSDKSSESDLAERPFSTRIPRDYCITSFSSLVESNNPELPDHDAPKPEPLLAESAGEPTGFHAFPGGTRTGNFIHEIFEQLDFSNAESVPRLVDRKLAAFSFPTEKWSAIVSDCIRQTLSAPLADGFKLGQIAASDRLPEVEFFLPAGRLDARRLSEILADGKRPFDFSPREGWLKGYIDLLLQHDGRFYIFDWKTNRLGDDSRAYEAARMDLEMIAHRYDLQMHLYTLAVHRYLRQRVPGYSYEKHFGAAYYLFVRGIDTAHPSRGVVRRRPTEKTILALEQWLENKQPELFELPV